VSRRVTSRERRRRRCSQIAVEELELVVRIEHLLLHTLVVGARASGYEQLRTQFSSRCHVSRVTTRRMRHGAPLEILTAQLSHLRFVTLDPS
jgi:hypothetical protein